jgi:Mce-associated membrane protein
MLAICLFLTAGAVGTWLSAGPDELRTAGNGQVTSTSYRSAAMKASAAHAAAVLSFGYKTLNADEKAARAGLTAGYTKTYTQTMKTTGPKAIKAKLTLKATVRSAALISLKKNSAKVLLFVNTVTTTVGSDLKHLNQDRVIMTMTRKDGDWFVSNLIVF